MNKPKLNQPDVETTTTNAFINDTKNESITISTSIPTEQFEKYLQQQNKSKLNKPIDYLQELKRDVSTKGSLTPFQKICFEHIEKELGQSNPTIGEVKPENVPFKKYKKLEMENEILKDVIIKLTVKIMVLEKELHPDIW